jgi:hypothetical protein
VWLLAPAPTANAAYQDATTRMKAQQSTPVELTGIVAPPRTAEQPEELAVLTIK